MRVACVIPALDAARTLAAVVRSVRQALEDAHRDVHGEVHVVVVDDGSRDDTAAVAERCADRVVRFAVNRGKGAALRAGFRAAAAWGASAILTIDADGQHDPAYAPQLLAALAAADIAIGQRARRGTSMPWHRRVSNALSSAAVSACAGRVLSDSQSGYRALRAAALTRLRPVGDRYEYETDLLIQASRMGLRIACVPVPTIYGAPSHFRPVGDSARVLGTILRRAVGRDSWPELGAPTRPARESTTTLLRLAANNRPRTPAGHGAFE
jgi:glycosyltransferase involved in cell wall biosynthesis